MYAEKDIEKAWRESQYLRHWLGAPPGMKSVALYRKTVKLALQLSSVGEEFKTETQMTPKWKRQR